LLVLVRVRTLSTSHFCQKQQQNSGGARCYFVREAAGTPGFLRKRKRRLLIISCKNSKNSGAAGNGLN